MLKYIQQIFKNMYKVIVYFLIIIDGFSESKNSEKCYDPKENFYPYMGSKTSYRFISSNMTRLGSDYEPQQLWMMARHGARYPSIAIIERILGIADTRDQILKNHQLGAGKLCAEDLKNLREWQMDDEVSTKNAETLAPQGNKDVQMLARRLRDFFPELLGSNNTNDYSFMSTGRESASYSLQAFAAELVGSGTGMKRALEVANKNDTILMSHMNCPAWVSSFIADRAYAERNEFTAGPQVQQLLNDVSRRLGFSNTLDFGKTRLMYEMCRLEISWNPNKSSPWCALFTKNELIIMEYREDLDYYYCCGPGNKMNAKLNCPSVKDMFQHFEQIENGNIVKQPKGIFYFAHSTNLQSLMSALHIGQDGPLLASAFESAKNRIYRSSLIGPFSANFIAVLYKCTDATSPYKVMFYLNENLVKMDGCDDGVCDLQFLKRKFGPEIKSCSLDFCYKNLPKGQSFVLEEWAKSRYAGSANRQTFNSMIAVTLILSCIIKQLL